MADFTITGLPDDLRAAVEAAARADGKSVDEVAIAALKRGMGQRALDRLNRRAGYNVRARATKRLKRSSPRPSSKREAGEPRYLDTNIYVSAFEFGGGPMRLLQMGMDGEVEGAVSQPIIDETVEDQIRLVGRP
jgi:hypothetical protein